MKCWQTTHAHVTSPNQDTEPSWQSPWLCVLLDKSRKYNIKSSFLDYLANREWFQFASRLCPRQWRDLVVNRTHVHPLPALHKSNAGSLVSQVYKSLLWAFLPHVRELLALESYHKWIRSRFITGFGTEFWRNSLRNVQSAALKAPFQEVRTWNCVALSRRFLSTGFSLGLDAEFFLFFPSFLSPVYIWRFVTLHAWRLEKNWVNLIWLAS